MKGSLKVVKGCCKEVGGSKRVDRRAGQRRANVVSSSRELCPVPSGSSRRRRIDSIPLRVVTRVINAHDLPSPASCSKWHPSGQEALVWLSCESTVILLRSCLSIKPFSIIVRPLLSRARHTLTFRHSRSVRLRTSSETLLTPFKTSTSTLNQWVHLTKGN